MKSKMEGLLVTGDFMNLTGTTRNTLIHYDNIGLLKPVSTNSRGDRFYHPFQAYNYLLIKTYQMAGMSLESIKEIMGDGKEMGLARIFNSKKDELMEARKGITQAYKEQLKTYRYIQKMLYVNDIYNKYDPYGEPVLDEFHIEGYSVITPLKNLYSMYDKEYYNEATMHVIGNHSRLRDEAFPLITHISKSSFMEGSVKAYAVASFTKYNVPNSRALDDVQGAPCVVLRRVGDIDGIMDSLNLIREFMKKNHLIAFDDIAIFTNGFLVDKNGRRVADRLFIAAVREGDADNIKFSSREKEDLSDDYANISGLLSSGDFLKICGITRNTLNFYQKNGLLQAAHVEENGYKKYGASQIYAMLHIKAMKYIGLSIEEIAAMNKASQKGINKYHYSGKLLKNQLANVEGQINELAEKRNTMKGLYRWIEQIAYMEKASNVKSKFNVSEKRCYRTVKPDEMLKGENILRGAITDAIKNISINKDTIPYPIGLVMDRDLSIENTAPFVSILPDKIREDDHVLMGDFFVHYYVGEAKNYKKVIDELASKIESEGCLRKDEKILMVLHQVKIEEEDKITMRALIIIPLENSK